MTRDFKKLTLDDAFVGLNAMLEEAEKDPSRPVSMGVCDEAGHMLCFYRMDGSGDFARELTMRKCSTSAQLGDSTSAIMKGLETPGRFPFYEFNHPYSTVVPGGVPIVPPGNERNSLGSDGSDIKHKRGQVGACAVTGRTGKEDETIAQIGVKAIQKLVWG